MKICDRHFAIDGSCVPATDQVEMATTGEAWDVCSSCADAVRETINPPAKEIPVPVITGSSFQIVENHDDNEKRRGRPRKVN